MLGSPTRSSIIPIFFFQTVHIFFWSHQDIESEKIITKQIYFKNYQKLITIFSVMV